MPDIKDSTNKFELLKSQVEKLTTKRSYPSTDISTDKPDEILKLIDEIRQHQVELEIRNENLKKDQQKIIRFHKDYEALYEYAPCGYFTLNAKGIITRLNLTGNNILDTDRNNIIRHSFKKFIKPGWENVFLNALANGEKTGQKQRIELPLKRSKGSSLWVQADIEADWNDDSGEVLLWRVVLFDISDKKKNIDALEESEKLHKATVENISDAVFISDDSGNLTYICPNVQVIFGLKSEHINKQRKVSFFFDPPIIQANKLHKQKEATNIEVTIADIRGRAHNLLVNAKSVSIGKGTILYSCRDITEKKQAEVALRESEKRYRMLYESMLNGVCLHKLIHNKQGEVVDYYILDVNHKYEEILNLKRSKVIGKKASQVYMSNEAPFLERYTRVAETGESLQFEAYFPPMNKYFIISVFSTEPGTFVTVFQDISSHKKAEKKLEKLNMALEEKVIERTMTLNETNTALKVLLRKREEDWKEIEANIMSNVDHLIDPYLQRIKETITPEVQTTLFPVLVENFKKLLSPFSRQISSLSNKLTPAEIKIADMVRHGLTNKEMADTLCLAPSTIAYHRENIRKKLGLVNKKVNLRSYLSEMENNTGISPVLKP